MKYEKKETTLEDAFNAFILSYDLEYKANPKLMSPPVFTINMNSNDATTDEKYGIIRAWNIGVIKEMDIVYSKRDDVVLFSITFYNTDNEMAEFFWNIQKALGKSKTYWLNFAIFDEFMKFFNIFMGKSMKSGTFYDPGSDAEYTDQF